MVLAPPTVAPLTPEQLETFPAILELQVTAEDVRLGIVFAPSMCPIALAARRRFDGLAVDVTCDLTVDEVHYLADDQDVFDHWIAAFDRGTPVSPTTFRFTKEEVTPCCP